ncbi:hypothetical protein ERO13_D03G004475v2 [Gossypium hirsutum]|nr:hypothetical protein ERO13_D03G004475v2 [Gossypium hirsutum]
MASFIGYQLLKVNSCIAALSLSLLLPSFHLRSFKKASAGSEIACASY